MDSTEADLLVALSGREKWALDELPSTATLEILCALDDEGFIEVCALNYTNMNPSGSGPWRFIEFEWYSPMLKPHVSGDWNYVLKQVERSERKTPWLLRLTSRGRVEVARIRRKNTRVEKSPGSKVRTETVVLWDGAEHSERNIRLARTRSAYLEAHGNVADALAALERAGNRVARRTFYNHLNALDEAIPHWRNSVLCNEPAQMHGTRIVGTRGKSRGKAG